MRRKIRSTLNEDEDAEPEQTERKRQKTAQIPPMHLEYGKLLWAKLGKFPWWPCIISKNPKVYNIVPKKPKIHVIFFGPKTEHSWVTQSSVLEYNGLNSFKSYAQEQVNQARTKSGKEKAALRYNLKILTTMYNDWQAAVDQADEALNMPQNERIDHFFCPKPEKPKHEPTNEEILDKKRIGVMALLENTFFRLNYYSDCFCLDKNVIVCDYLGPEFGDPKLGIPAKDVLFKRLDYVQEMLEKIYKDRIKSHGNSEHFKADNAILRAIRAIKESIPMLEIDLINRYFVSNSDLDKNVIYERFYDLKYKLFQNRSNLKTIEKILDSFYQENPETNRPMCSSEL